jgi:hypothetical protein
MASGLSPQSPGKELDFRARSRLSPAAKISAISANRSAAVIRSGDRAFRCIPFRSSLFVVRRQPVSGVWRSAEETRVCGPDWDRCVGSWVIDDQVFTV